MLHLIVGENALVGAGSGVAAGVPPHTVVAGSRVRVVRDVDEFECHFEIVKPRVNGP